MSHNPSARNDSRPCCNSAKDAVAYWRARVEPELNRGSVGESLWVIVLKSDRLIASIYQVTSRVFSDATQFAKVLLDDWHLKSAPEFVVVQHRAGFIKKPTADDISRVRSVILAGRIKKTELLDWVILGKPDDLHPTGWLSYYKMRGFSALEPFAKKAVKK